MTHSEVKLSKVQLPEFGLPKIQPLISSKIYQSRINQTLKRANEAGFDLLVIYGDREHFANLTYLTGYDPRFEEALLILGNNRPPSLLVGLEGWGYAEISPIKLNRILLKSFSLMGTTRDNEPMLEKVLRAEGIRSGSHVGVVGWKYFDSREATNPECWLEVPSFIVDVLREITGDKSLVKNATSLFMNPENGLRTINELDQLANFEFASTYTSQAIKNALFGLEPGMTEFDVVRLMKLNGLPHSVHLMLSSGPRAAVGLSSPQLRIIDHGDPFFVAYGLHGALNARGGFVVKNANELSENISDYLEKLVVPYFQAIVEWYELVGIGVKGSELYELIDHHLGDPFFGIMLNPGHYIHLDEWVNSPIDKGSNIELKSGMALQVDVIPSTGTPYFTTNIEDGIALADEKLRSEFEKKYPESWSRIQGRRQFMKKELGIRLKPEILPFSNIPAYLPPFLLNPSMAMRVIH